MPQSASNPKPAGGASTTRPWTVLLVFGLLATQAVAAPLADAAPRPGPQHPTQALTPGVLARQPMATASPSEALVPRNAVAEAVASAAPAASEGDAYSDPTLFSRSAEAEEAHLFKRALEEAAARGQLRKRQNFEEGRIGSGGIFGLAAGGAILAVILLSYIISYFQEPRTGHERWVHREGMGVDMVKRKRTVVF